MTNFINVANQRLGVSLVEVMAALVLMSTLAIAVSQVAVAVVAQQRRDTQNAIALLELENQAETIATMRFADINQKTLNDLRLSKATTQLLSKAKLNIAIAEETSPSALRLTLTLRWGVEEDRLGRSSELVIWRFEEGA